LVIVVLKIHSGDDSPQSQTQNEAQNETHCAKVLKMFPTDELAELIVHETNA
jgi:hypothetical protein